MNTLITLYNLALRLFPAAFRARFADEMSGVFAEGLADARRDGQQVGFLVNELFKLPVSLAHVYLWSARAGAGQQVALSGGPGSSTLGSPQSTRGEAVLAGAPYLVMFVVLVLPEWLAALTGQSGGLEQWYSLFSWIFVAAFVLAVGVYGLKKGFKTWAGAYIPLALALLMGAAGWLAEVLLVGERDSGVLNNLLTALVLPLALAYALYKLARGSRHAALLGALPVMSFTWTLYLEFTPQPLRLASYAFSIALGFAASMVIARERRVIPALLAALAASALGGLFVVILALTVGGYVEANNPQPLVLQVLGLYLPFLGGVSALALGPLLASVARSLGRESSGAGGNLASRVALGGILILIVAVLIEQTRRMDGGWLYGKLGLDLQFFIQANTVLLYAGAAVYLVGFLLLARAALRSGALSGENGAALSMLLLFFALPGVPLVINGMLAFGPEGGAVWLRAAAASAWVVLATWAAVRWHHAA